MAQQDRNGFPWQGVETNWTLSNVIPEALGGAQVRATEEAAEHPGLYQARYDDIPTIQLTLRPGYATSPDELEMVAGEAFGNDTGEVPPYD